MITQKFRNYPYVDVPCHFEVAKVFDNQKVSDTYFARGRGEAIANLEETEAMHREWVSSMIDLSDFLYCYATHGTTDAIHHWVMTENRGSQVMCYGEYEYSSMIGLPRTVTCDVPGQYMENGRSAIPGIALPDVPLFVSIPSAADGNIFNPGFENWKVKPPVILDCTYVGSTKIEKINVPSTTEQVFFSFSKGFGAIGQRLGLVYTKKPHASLHRLKKYENWNYGSVMTMKLLMETFTVDEMWNTYNGRQLEICKEYGFKPSSVYYLATTKDEYYKKRRRMKWNDDARICLTPLFEERIR